MMKKRTLTMAHMAGGCIALPAMAEDITFKLNQNGDPTDGGTHPEWTLSGSRYVKPVGDPLLYSYGVDLDGDASDDVLLELSSQTPGANELMLSGTSAAGMALKGNGVPFKKRVQEDRCVTLSNKEIQPFCRGVGS
jgi:hypothetical protein